MFCALERRSSVKESEPFLLRAPSIVSTHLPPFLSSASFPQVFSLVTNHRDKTLEREENKRPTRTTLPFKKKKKKKGNDVGLAQTKAVSPPSLSLSLKPRSSKYGNSLH
jgi:hypothetical protein